jgi:hypothetical protein
VLGDAYKSVDVLWSWPLVIRRATEDLPIGIIVVCYALEHKIKVIPMTLCGLDQSFYRAGRTMMESATTTANQHRIEPEMPLNL